MALEWNKKNNESWWLVAVGKCCHKESFWNTVGIAKQMFSGKIWWAIRHEGIHIFPQNCSKDIAWNLKSSHPPFFIIRSCFSGRLWNNEKTRSTCLFTKGPLVVVFDIERAVFVLNFTERKREDLSSKVCCGRDILLPRRFCMCIYAHSHMGVSKNRGTPNWMVYIGKPY